MNVILPLVVGLLFPLLALVGFVLLIGFVLSKMTGMEFKRIMKSIKSEDPKNLKYDPLTTKGKVVSFLMGMFLALFGIAIVSTYYRGLNQEKMYKDSIKFSVLGMVSLVVIYVVIVVPFLN